MAPRAFECGEGEALIAGRDMLILWGRESCGVLRRGHVGLLRG